MGTGADIVFFVILIEQLEGQHSRWWENVTGTRKLNLGSPDKFVDHRNSGETVDCHRDW